jgi:Tfp pilus assembly major pilin PilA
MRRHRGFITFWDLMIAVAILGSIASLAIPNYLEFRRREEAKTACIEWRDRKTDATICRGGLTWKRCEPEVIHECVKSRSER